MNPLRSLRLPLAGWLTIAIALCTGLALYVHSPGGYLFVSAINACAATRTHPFGIGYGAVLVAGALGLLLEGVASRRRAMPAYRALRRTALMALLIAGLLTPVWQFLLPLQVAPGCSGRP